MTEAVDPKDFIVLVADKNMEFAVRGLFSRSESLSIQIPEYDIYIHPHHDPGCFKRGHNLLLPYQSIYKHALVMFDREGCGKENLSRVELESQVEDRMNQSGWNGRNAAIAIDPELGNWVWSTSPHVEIFLGWREEFPNLRD